MKIKTVFSFSTSSYKEDEYIPSLWENIRWTVEAWIDYPKDKFRQLKWFYQRGKRGYADCDVWSLDCYLSSWLPEALEQLKDNESYPDVRGVENAKQWNKRLTEMIEGFSAAKGLINTEWRKGEEIKQVRQRQEKQKKVFDKGIKQFVEYYFCLWD